MLPLQMIWGAPSCPRCHAQALRPPFLRQACVFSPSMPKMSPSPLPKISFFPQTVFSTALPYIGFNSKWKKEAAASYLYSNFNPSSVYNKETKQFELDKVKSELSKVETEGNQMISLAKANVLHSIAKHSQLLKKNSITE